MKPRWVMSGQCLAGQYFGTIHRVVGGWRWELVCGGYKYSGLMPQEDEAKASVSLLLDELNEQARLWNEHRRQQRGLLTRGALTGIVVGAILSLWALPNPAVDRTLFLTGFGAVVGLLLGWMRQRSSWGTITGFGLLGFLTGLLRGR